MKKCSKCKEFKSFNEFYKQKGCKNGVHSKCKICFKNDNKNYNKTKESLISKIYNQQKIRSKHRKHLPPSYTKQNLKDWLFSQEKFHKLYDNWVKNSYEKKLIPSVDRKKDNLPYSLDNIQLMTWEQNNRKANKDKRSGKLIVTSNPQKPVIKYDKQENFIKEYVSAHQASRETGINRGGISSACRCELKSAGGFKWNFK